jgi:Mn-dependent DtxR family transcriptional regulator
MTNDLLFAVLFSIFDLAREDRPAHLGNVASRVGAERTDVVKALRHLERKGLVDAAGCRLSMRGLLVATALRRACVNADRIAHTAAA